MILLGAGLGLALLLTSGCVSVETKLLGPPRPLVCRDGKPVRILQHPDCDHGICGYSCLPDRWIDYQER